MRKIVTLIALACGLVAGGCGYKGPLYLPKDKPAPAAPDRVAPTTQQAPEDKTP